MANLVIWVLKRGDIKASPFLQSLKEGVISCSSRNSPPPTTLRHPTVAHSPSQPTFTVFLRSSLKRFDWNPRDSRTGLARIPPHSVTRFWVFSAAVFSRFSCDFYSNPRKFQWLMIDDLDASFHIQWICFVCERESMNLNFNFMDESQRQRHQWIAASATSWCGRDRERNWRGRQRVLGRVWWSECRWREDQDRKLEAFCDLFCFYASGGVEAFIINTGAILELFWTQMGEQEP